MSDTAELIARLREATEADPAYDEMIVKALYPEAVVDYYIEGDDEKTVFHAEPLVQNKRELPHFTASLDAALRLVPEGYAVLIGTMGFKGTTRKPYACLWRPDGFLLPTAEATTPALALCIAAILARKEP